MDAPRCTVLYNADCPICSREIAAYARAAHAAGAPLAFEPLAGADLAAWGLTDDAARRRLHLRREGEGGGEGGGAVLAGLPAFLALWDELPRLRWLARLLRLPLIRPAAGALYERVLAPALFALDRRRRARAVSQGRTTR